MESWIVFSLLLFMAVQFNWCLGIVTASLELFRDIKKLEIINRPSFTKRSELK